MPTFRSRVQFPSPAPIADYFKVILIIDYKSIIISSPPRTGSMWTQNVVREIFKSQKINITPQKIIKNEDDALKCHFESINSNKNNFFHV